MASNPELERMINNLEKAIGKVRLQINMLPTIWDHKSGNLSNRFLELRSKQSKLIELSTNLQKQHLENYQLQREEQTNG